MTETNRLWVGTIGMFAGSIPRFLLGDKRIQDEERLTIAHAIVPLFAAISYFAMAMNRGTASLPGGR